MVPFIVVELGADADPFMLRLFAALAEKELAMFRPAPRRRWRRRRSAALSWATRHWPRPASRPRKPAWPVPTISPGQLAR